MNTNLAVLFGIVNSEPTCRDLAGGATVAQFDVVTVVDRDGRDANVSVPVSWLDATPRALSGIVVGEEVVIVGRVERRFFRSGGATQSRTEVVITQCVPSRRAKTVRSVLAAAVDSLVGP